MGSLSDDPFWGSFYNRSKTQVQIQWMNLFPSTVGVFLKIIVFCKGSNTSVLAESVNLRILLPSLPSNIWRKIHLEDHWTIGAWPGFKSSRSSISLPPQMCHQTDNIIANGNKMQSFQHCLVPSTRALEVYLWTVRKKSFWNSTHWKI